MITVQPTSTRGGDYKVVDNVWWAERCFSLYRNILQPAYCFVYLISVTISRLKFFNSGCNGYQPCIDKICCTNSCGMQVRRGEMKMSFSRKNNTCEKKSAFVYTCVWLCVCVSLCIWCVLLNVRVFSFSVGLIQAWQHEWDVRRGVYSIGFTFSRTKKTLEIENNRVS